MNKLFLTLPLLSFSLASYAAEEAAPSTMQGQSSERRDRDLSAKIRESVDEDHSLSTEAHSVKIIARDGFVTLRGPVRTNIERMVVSEKAKDIAGDRNVKNELRVAK
jgi:hyperosmotically inducible periplasmic protein